MGKCGWSAEGFVMRENSDILFNEVKGVNLGREEVLGPYEKEKMMRTGCTKVCIRKRLERG